HIEGQFLLGNPHKEPAAEPMEEIPAEDAALLPRFEPKSLHTRVSYALAVTKTFTEEVPCFSNFTTFVETFAATNLDGENPGRTNFSILPGVRWEPCKHWWIGSGVDFPLSGPRIAHAQYFLTLIREF